MVNLSLVAYPSFIDYSRYATDYHCDLYPLPPVSYNDPVEMTVNVSEDNIILTWYAGDGHIIDCDPCDDYQCTNDNKVSSLNRVTLCIIAYAYIYWNLCNLSLMLGQEFLKSSLIIIFLFLSHNIYELRYWPYVSIMIVLILVHSQCFLLSW